MDPVTDPSALAPLEPGTVTVRWHDDEIEYVSIVPRWQQHATISQITAAIVDQVNERLGAAAFESASFNADDRSLDWGDLMDLSRRLERYNRAASARLAANSNEPQFTTSAGRHVRSLWYGSQLIGFDLDAEWAESVPVQSLADAITEAVRQAPAVAPSSNTKEFAAAKADLEQFWS